MKCKICGRECPPGAKICRDCASARKRAFAVTVTEPLLAAAGLPSVGEPKFAPKPVHLRPRPRVAPPVDSETAPAEAPAALPLHVVPRSFGVHWLLIGLAVTTAIIVLLIKVLAGGSGRTTEDAGTAVSSAASPTAVVVIPAPVPPTATGSVQDTATQAKPQSDLPPTKSKPLTHRAPPRVDAPSAVVTTPPTPEPAPVARPVSPPPRPVEAPRVDPWQAMNEGLSRCAREDFLSRAACEQRLRLQYCGNYWGLVPQCPIGPATDHGQ